MITTLTVPDQNFTTTDFEEIQAYLKERGVAFTRWQAGKALADEATQAEILAAYEHELTPFMQAGGFQSADVINVHQGTPNIAALRAKFLSEHTHTEDEVRFFVAGAGKFWFHFDSGEVAAITCVKGDFLAVPSGIKHWFDLSPHYHVKAIRIFTGPDGWVAHYTESGVDQKYNPKD